MNAKNGTAFVTKFAPRRACIAPPRARSRECREVTRIQEQPRTSFPVARGAPEKAVSAQLARFVFFVFSSSAAFNRARPGGSAAEGGSSPRRVSMEAILEVRRLRPRRLAPRCGPHDRSTDEGPAREGSSKDLLGSAESAYESGSTASTTSHRPSSTRS